VKYAFHAVALVLMSLSPAHGGEGAIVGPQLSSSTSAPPPAAAPSPAAKARSSPRAVTYATVEQPRLTGYFVGDLLTQRVLLQRNGQTLTPATLPPTGRVSAWFERHRVTTTTDAALRHWLVVEYQILNAPPKLANVTLPAWQLTVAGSSSATPLTLSVPSVSINVAALSPPGSPEQVGTRDLRPDRLPPVIPTAPIRRTIALAASALALTLIAWICWVVWRNRRAIATQPFARALREMRSLGDNEPRAWQALHRAFDRTAGRVIQSATLPVLFERAPQLAPARAQIEMFFTQSNMLFFGSATTNSSSMGSASTASLPRTLCAELLRIERRHER
jgi:mxaA protein